MKSQEQKVTPVTLFIVNDRNRTRIHMQKQQRVLEGFYNKSQDQWKASETREVLIISVPKNVL